MFHLGQNTQLSLILSTLTNYKSPVDWDPLHEDVSLAKAMSTLING